MDLALFTSETDDHVRKDIAWEGVLYGLDHGIANFRLAGWEEFPDQEKEAFVKTVLSLYADKEDYDRAKITQFFRQLFVELTPDWQYKCLLLLYASWRGEILQRAIGALQVLKSVWQALSEENREEALQLLASGLEGQKDAFTSREIVATLQLLHSKLNSTQKEAMVNRYFEWLPGKDPDLTGGVLDAIRDILEDYALEERASIAAGKTVVIADLLNHKKLGVAMAAMRLVELLFSSTGEDAQSKFLAAAVRVLKNKDVQNYREIFLSLKNVWNRIAPHILAEFAPKLHPMILKLYHKRQTLEPTLSDAIEDFLEDFWEALPDDLKDAYY
ncbi:MAG TPA: hypothetical protein VKK79_08675 [Candidatus Lokiarchaeia archaeon]|nr:hypothetical protein [Candidatus Lokiarchaeia archaeon]